MARRDELRGLLGAYRAKADARRDSAENREIEALSTPLRKKRSTWRRAKSRKPSDA